MESARADMIRLLEAELDLIEGGGYADRAGRPGSASPMFYHSVACINHWLVPDHEHECHDDCILLQAVPEQHRNEALPCHFIPLNERGDTLHSLAELGDRERMEGAVKGWLKRTVQRLKAGDAVVGLPDVKY